MQEGKEHPRISELKGSWRHCNKAHIAHRYGSRFGDRAVAKGMWDLPSLALVSGQEK